MPATASRSRARRFVSYSLQRRAVLTALQRGSASRDDVCDAHPHLSRAARFHGERIGRRCPVCRRPEMALLRYVYSDELGQYSGRIRSAAEIVEMAGEHGQLAVYVVEVCRNCSWNHLVASYVVGAGIARRPPRRRHTVEDDD